jgi:xanthine dehydrogenase accessory factor
MTYSHALDLAICHAVLRRGDFGHLGLIGSATKRVRFMKRLTELGIAPSLLARLTCPIGIPGLGGKEPSMIAVAVAAQLVQLAMAGRERATGGADLIAGDGAR